MNERIRQLAIETDAWCDENWLGHVMYNRKWEEKFANLIIRECITKAEQEEDRFTELGETDLAYAMQNFQYLLKQDFGVTE